MLSPVESAIAPPSLCHIGEFLFDLEEHVLFQGAMEIPLRPKSLNVLQYLVEHRGHLVSKSELMEAVWPNLSVSENSLTQCLTEVRRALGSRERHIIRTIPGRGYLLQVDEDHCFLHSSTIRQSGTGQPVREPLEHDTCLPPLFINSSDDFHSSVRGIPAALWQKQLDLYFDLCHTASTICNFEGAAPERSSAERIFWILYWGPVVLVADERFVTPAVKAFASAIHMRAPNEILRSLCLELASSCRKSLKLVAEVPLLTGNDLGGR
jgi:DNA-binding winged helix-turn-helix (wHTH) protein